MNDIGRMWAVVAAITLWFPGCGGSDEPRLRDQLAGQWQWVQSVGGYAGDTLTPQIVGYQFALAFRSGQEYTEYRDGRRWREGSYRVTDGVASNSATQTRPILEFEQAIVLSSASEPDLAIERVTSDTLVLSERHSEAQYHTLIRLDDRDRRQLP